MYMAPSHVSYILAGFELCHLMSKFIVDLLSGTLNRTEPIPELPVSLALGDQPGCSGWQLVKDNYYYP